MKRPSTKSNRLADLTPTQLQAGIDRLVKLVDRVKRFDPTTVDNQYDIPDVQQLSAAIDEALVRTFGPDTLDYERYRYAADFDNGPHNYACEVPISEVHQSLSRSKGRNVALLEQAIETLRERLAEMPSSPSIADLVKAPSETTAASNQNKSRRVFVVHGHDEGAREAVARFLERMDFEAIILHERANQGRTVIEKVEVHSDVGFAVVLLTPDDEGCVRGGSPEPRARQNVLLELGYFIGKLTRARVCTLKVGQLEIPSDWRGVVDEPFDRAERGNRPWRENWQLPVLRLTGIW